MLILAGDITVIENLKSGNPDSRKGQTKKHTIDLFNQVSAQFPHVVVIMGNHEYYYGNWNHKSQDEYREFLKQWPNVHLLECGVLDLPQARILGATLFTDMNRSDTITLYTVKDGMSDFQQVRVELEGYRRLTPQHTVIRHQETMKWLRAQLAVDTKPVIFVGHHAPSSQSVDHEYRSPRYTHANYAYYSNLEDFILDHTQIKFWCHGHMHSHSDYMIGDTRVIANPRGYLGYEARAAHWQLQYYVLDV